MLLTLNVFRMCRFVALIALVEMCTVFVIDSESLAAPASENEKDAVVKIDPQLLPYKKFQAKFQDRSNALVQTR